MYKLIRFVHKINFYNLRFGGKVIIGCLIIEKEIRKILNGNLRSMLSFRLMMLNFLTWFVVGEFLISKISEECKQLNQIPVQLQHQRKLQHQLKLELLQKVQVIHLLFLCLTQCHRHRQKQKHRVRLHHILNHQHLVHLKMNSLDQ